MPHQTGSVTVKAAYIMAAGAVIAAIITGIVLFIASQPTIQTTVSGQNNITVTPTESGPVHITSTRGISEDQFQKLAEEFGVTKAALKSFFKILEQRAVPSEDLDSTLRTIAERYKALDEKLKTFVSDDPTVQALKEQARQALEAGKFDRAEQLLNEASEKDLQAVQQIEKSTEELEAIIEKNKVIIRKRRLSAAASKAENGDLKYTQLAYGEAAAYYRQAAELVPADEKSTLAEYLNFEGIVWLDAGQYTKAQTPLERALDIREKTLGAEHSDVATSLNNLALLYKTQGQYAQAEPLYQRALHIYKKALGAEHPDVATSLNNLAELYRTQGQYVQAEPFYQRALHIHEKALGAEHPAVATSLNNLAVLYYAQGQYAQAEPLYQRALHIREKALGAEHPDVATSLNNLAELYRTQGQYAQAEPLFQRALAIDEKALGAEHPDLAIDLNNLAALYYAQGQYAQAEPLSQRALQIAEKALGPEHPNSVTIRKNYANLLAQMKQAGIALSAPE